MTVPEALPALLPREAGLVILTVSMQKISLLKKQTVLTCTACHSEDLSTKKLFKIWRGFFLSLNNVSSLSFLCFEFQRGLTFHISEECLTFQTLFHLCFVIFLSNPHVRPFLSALQKLNTKYQQVPEPLSLRDFLLN